MGSDRIYFIADLHLSNEHPELTDAFERFLLFSQAHAKALYILGDFFNAWIGDDDNSRLVTRIKTALNNYSAKGIAVYFMHGNRDFLIGERFANACGMTILPEGSQLELHGKKTVLMHGDSLCTDDIAYQAFRTKVRNPAWQQKMLSYPLFVRKGIAAYLRWRSRRSNQYKTNDIMDVALPAVEETFKTTGAMLLIHGHTHRPARHLYKINGIECERIVLGDWGKSLWYLEVSEQGIHLIEKDIFETFDL